MSLELLRDGAAVVAYHDGADLDQTMSRRPYLTATTPSGHPVTELAPDDHLHHMGLSAAFPDVDGTSFWGGRTYVRDIGSTLLKNHGEQRATSRTVADGVLEEEVHWSGHDGVPLISEQRRIVARIVDGAVEVLWTSALTALRDISFGSPQTNGRDGAFYGGLFWRTPFGQADVRTADADTVDEAHGSSSPWIAVDGAEAALVAVTADGLPWFVRADGYCGFGPALAVQERRHLSAGETLHLDLAVWATDSTAPDPAAVAGALLADLKVVR